MITFTKQSHRRYRYHPVPPLLFVSLPRPTCRSPDNSQGNTALAKSQQGVALVISLVLLVLVTILALAGARTANLEEKMAANGYDRNLAFQAAEAALREAEISVAASRPTPASGSSCSNGICPQPVNGATPRWEDQSFTGWTNATVSLGTLAGTTPQYFIEYLGSSFPCRDGESPPSLFCKRYRITARSHPGTDRATVTLQSIYATE